VTHRSVSVAFAGAVLLAVAASVPAGYARGQDTPKSSAARPIPYKEEPGFADQLVNVGLAFACVMVVGAIGIGGYRYLTGARPRSPGRRLRIVETLRLAPRTTLFVVEFDRRTLLIGQHGDRLSLLLGSDPGSPGLRGGEGGQDESPR
jgi:hypothetical protein